MISDELLAITNQNRKRKLKRSVKKKQKEYRGANKSVMSLLGWF